MGGALTITVRSECGVVIAAVTGEIDISTVTQLREHLFELADHGDADREPEPGHVHRLGRARGTSRDGSPRR
jgi:hypothetical protein